MIVDLKISPKYLLQNTSHITRAQLVLLQNVFSFFSSSKSGSVLAFPAHVSLGEKNETTKQPRRRRRRKSKSKSRGGIHHLGVQESIQRKPILERPRARAKSDRLRENENLHVRKLWHRVREDGERDEFRRWGREDCTRGVTRGSWEL